MEFKPTFDWIREPLAAGNTVTGVERCLQRINSAETHILRQRLLREVMEILQQCRGRLTAGECTRIRQLLTENPHVTTALTAYIEAVQESTTLPQVDIPGKVNALFVVNSREPFGCVRALNATAFRGDRTSRGPLLMNPHADTLMPQTLSKVNVALQQFLMEKGLTHAGRGNYLSYDFPLEIGIITEKYEGCSLGLAGAVALLSALIRQAVPPLYAFTGDVSITGEVHAVGGIPEKIAAAADKGITTVFLPRCNVQDVPHAHRERVKGIERLKEVFDQVFDPEKITAFVQEMNELQTPAAVHEETFAQRARGGNKVLISCVGDRDPYGTSYRDKTREVAEGAILTAFRKVMPSAVCLLATPTLKERGEATMEALQTIAPACKVHLDVLDISDPTVYDDLMYEMGGKTRRFLQKTQAAHGPEKALEPYLILSSGTPQMQVVWVHLLNAEETLRETRVLQVREPQFVLNGEERVREIVSTFLKIGTP
jgi:hypothetical protein